MQYALTRNNFQKLLLLRDLRLRRICQSGVGHEAVAARDLVTDLSIPLQSGKTADILRFAAESADLPRLPHCREDGYLYFWTIVNRILSCRLCPKIFRLISIACSRVISVPISFIKVHSSLIRSSTPTFLPLSLPTNHK